MNYYSYFIVYVYFLTTYVYYAFLSVGLTVVHVAVSVLLVVYVYTVPHILAVYLSILYFHGFIVYFLAVSYEYSLPQ